MPNWMIFSKTFSGLQLPELIAALVAVFIAAALALEGLLLLWHRQRSPAAQRMRARLKAWMPELEEGAQTRRGAWSPKARSGLGTALQEGPPSGPAWWAAAREHPQWTALIRTLELRLQQAGWGWTPAALLGLCAALALLTMLAVMLGIERVPAIAALLAGLGVASAPLLLLERQRHLRLQRLGEQLPDALDLMGRALRSGHAFASALQMAAAESPAPIGPTLGLVHDQISWGREPDEAFEDLARRAPLDDVRFFVVAVRLQRQTGGRLAEVLGNIAAMVRHRMRLKDKVRVLSAEGRLSALVLAALPLMTALVIHLIRPDFIAVLWTDPAGLRWLQVSTALFGAGVLWLWRLTRITV